MVGSKGVDIGFNKASLDISNFKASKPSEGQGISYRRPQAK